MGKGVGTEGGDKKMLPGDHFQFRKQRAGAAGPHRWPRIWIRSAVPSDNRPANLMLVLQTPFELLCLQLSMQKKSVLELKFSLKKTYAKFDFAGVIKTLSKGICTILKHKKPSSEKKGEIAAAQI